jgi:hypothetical protein
MLSALIRLIIADTADTLADISAYAIFSMPIYTLIFSAITPLAPPLLLRRHAASPIRRRFHYERHWRRYAYFAMADFRYFAAIAADAAAAFAFLRFCH